MRSASVLLVLVISVAVAAAAEECGVEASFRTGGDVHLVIFVNECDAPVARTAVLSAAWICRRLGVLELFGNLRLGATVYAACDPREMVGPLLTASGSSGYDLGFVTWGDPPEKIEALAGILGVPLARVTRQWRTLITASVELLTALRWNENVTVVTSDSVILHFFLHESRKEWICVKSILELRDSIPETGNPVVMIGTGSELSVALGNISDGLGFRVIAVPVDGAQVQGLPEGSFVIQPPLADLQQTTDVNPKIIPGPVLLDIAVPIINIAKNLSDLLLHSCNETFKELVCLKEHRPHFPPVQTSQMSPYEVVSYLKILPLQDKFVYDVYRVANLVAQTNESTDLQTWIKIGRYDLFNFTLHLNSLYAEEEPNASSEDVCSRNHKVCVDLCVNYKPLRKVEDEPFSFSYVALKQDPWILAILSVAGIGVLFCVAILTFIFVRLCKRDVLEGNPVTSVLLLLALTLMYASVLPFALEAEDLEYERYVCAARSLCVTLSYGAAFSLMLSRCVMLASVANDAGFMSHVAGHVQSLLCLFMVAVQGALCLQQVVGCHESFEDLSFLHALSYDGLLLVLLVCACPFVCRSRRNYREGRHFAVAAVLVSCCWAGWLAAYVLVPEGRRPSVVCCGLLATASSVLGAVFVPRTYLMTGALVRDSLTSALPSLAFATSSTSALNLGCATGNATATQHIYDCVNVNAGGVLQAQCRNPNYYSNEPEADRADSQGRTTPDKVTRF